MKNRCLLETYHPGTAAWGHYLGTGKRSGNKARHTPEAPRVGASWASAPFVIDDCTVHCLHESEHQDTVTQHRQIHKDR